MRGNEQSRTHFVAAETMEAGCQNVFICHFGWLKMLWPVAKKAQIGILLKSVLRDDESSKKKKRERDSALNKSTSFWIRLFSLLNQSLLWLVLLNSKSETFFGEFLANWVPRQQAEQIFWVILCHVICIVYSECRIHFIVQTNQHHCNKISHHNSNSWFCGWDSVTPDNTFAFLEVVLCGQIYLGVKNGRWTDTCCRPRYVGVQCAHTGILGSTVFIWFSCGLHLSLSLGKMTSCHLTKDSSLCTRVHDCNF